MEVSTSISMIGGGVRGEVRRLNIVYFLSRTSCVEHPHLIRVHHLIRSGVFLRDVKKWLAELRGKDMPEAFAWSYKRRYKNNGYVWQDLMDDDLITPISDNEYILKGSEILPVSPRSGLNTNSAVVKRKTKVVDEDPEVEVDHKQEDLQEHLNHNIDTSSVQSCQSYPESLSSTLTDDDSLKQEDTTSKHSSPEDPPVSSSVAENLLPSLYCEFDANHSKKRNNQIKKERTLSSPFACGLQTHHKSQFARGTKSSSSGTTKMIWNLMRCGGTDINDAVLVARKKSNPATEHGDESRFHNRDTVKGPMQAFRAPFKLQYLQHETRKNFHGVQNSKNQQRLSGTGRRRTLAAPTCSQCGKCFRPEKLHTHMKSCRGMRGPTKNRRANANQ